MRVSYKYDSNKLTLDLFFGIQRNIEKFVTQYTGFDRLGLQRIV